MRLFGLFILFALSSCDHKAEIQQLSGPTMGTRYTVKWISNSEFDKKKLANKITSILSEVNRQMSTYLSDSEISQLNRATIDQKLAISPWFFSVADYSLKLAHQTNGVFDPTIGPLVNIWGFGPKGERKIPPADKIALVKKYVGYRKVKLNRTSSTIEKTHSKVYLDLSATAKGFAVDELARLLEQHAIENYLIEVGGEMKAKGQKNQHPWTIAIEKPDENQRAIEKVIPLRDLAIATSGSYRNFFKSGNKTYSHTIDRNTGRPIAHNLVSVSVLDINCMNADGLATALMAMGPEMAWSFAVQHEIAAFFIIAQENSRVTTRMTKKFANWSQ